MSAPNKVKFDKVNNALTKFGTSSFDANALHQFGVDLGDDLLSEMDMRMKTFDALKYPEMIKSFKEKAAALDDEIKKGSLLTLGFVSNYINNNWDSLTFKLEYLKGLGIAKDKDKPWDIYAAAFYDLKKDTSINKALNRQVLSGKFGLNKVLIKNSDQKSSFIEILGAGELDYISKGAYNGENKTRFMADFVLTIRLTPTIFLPFEFKYDPKDQNVFGFLKIKWDLPRTSGKE
jgi:hypothetical protein